MGEERGREMFGQKIRVNYIFGSVVLCNSLGPAPIVVNSKISSNLTAHSETAMEVSLQLGKRLGSVLWLL
jgi:hypothetical protein